MKHLVAGLCLVLASFALGNDVQPETVQVGLQKAYVPIGFDSNDQSQLVVAGTFPNTCYQVGLSRADVDAEAKTITLTQEAYVYQGVCLRVIVPFDQVVELGILEPGEYRIVDGITQKELGAFPVARATNPGTSTDDFPYAPVRDAFITKCSEPGGSCLILEGAFLNRCMRLKKVEVCYQSDVIVVLPIVEMIDAREGRGCTGGVFRFQKRIPLRELEDHAYLLHVRSMNGKSLNKIHYVEENN